MTTITRSSTVKFSQEQMFTLVNDIKRYPEFLPWCAKAQILHQTENEIEATLYISKGPITHSFTTKNHLKPYQLIEMNLVQGPFKALKGKWNFSPLTQGTYVTFSIDFEFSNKLLALALGPLFNHIAGTMVSAFIERAKQLYE